MQLGEKLLVNFPEKVSANATPLYKAILHCVTVTCPETRKKNLAVLRRMVNGLGGPSISKVLFAELLKLLLKPPAPTKNDKDSNEESTELLPHAVVECIVTLCSSSGLTPEHLRALAIDSLLPTHHPSVVKLSPNLWVKILKFHNIKSKDLIGQTGSELRKIFIDNYQALPVGKFVY